MRVWPIIACAALGIACGKSPSASESDTQRPAAAIDAGASATAAKDAGADLAACRRRVGRAFGSVRGSYAAKDFHGPRQSARRTLAEVPAACRDGKWFLIAAMLLDSPASRPVEAPGLVVSTRDEALAAAIAMPPDRNVFVHVAFVAALGGTTKLPADACAFVEADVAALPAEVRDSLADEAHYVCGHAALAAEDAATAKTRFDAIRESRRYADLELRQAEAELALGNPKAAKTLAKKAAAMDTSRTAHDASWTDREAIVAAAKAIAK